MKTTNSQAIMYGYANGNSAAVATGRTDAVKTPSGSEVSNTDGKHACKYRGIENLWGNTFTWCDGISLGGDNSYKEKIFVCTDPKSYAAGKITSPYVYHGNRTSGGYIKKVAPLNRNPLIQYAAETSGGSETTYFADYASAHGSVLAVGGDWVSGTDAGLWFWYGYCTPSYSSASIGGRLCKKPL